MVLAAIRSDRVWRYAKLCHTTLPRRKEIWEEIEFDQEWEKNQSCLKLPEMERKLVDNDFEYIQHYFWCFNFDRTPKISDPKKIWVQHFLRPNSYLVRNYIGKFECGSAQPSLFCDLS